MLKIHTTSKHHPLHSRRRTIRLPLGTQRFLAAFEGIEGGFAIGASVIVALSVAGIQKELLLATAVITIIVSGFNSATVKYSSEHYLDELDGHEKKSSFNHYFMPALIEFCCYLLLSLLTVIPLIIINDIKVGVVASAVATIGLLFIAGMWRAYILRMKMVRDGIETAVLGLGIIVIGLLSGIVVSSL